MRRRVRLGGVAGLAVLGMSVGLLAGAWGAGAPALTVQTTRFASTPRVYVDAFVQQGKKLAGPTGAGEQLGHSVAISANGDIALIGDAGPDFEQRKGAAWIFTRSGSKWTQQSELRGSEDSGSAFGYSVALSADGDTALIGGPTADNGKGAAWVFTRSRSSWTQRQRLTGAESFGFSVAISRDGQTALIGGPGGNDEERNVGPAAERTEQEETSPPLPNDGRGAVSVFRRTGSSWVRRETLTTTHDEESFGQNIALSADGSTALIASGEKSATFVFTHSRSRWTEQSELPSSGRGVALSADGNTALVGDPDEGGVGSARIFTRSGSTWSKQGATLVGNGEIAKGYPGQFGESVALSGDGDAALIGGSGDDGRVGAARVFRRSGSTWTQSGEKISGSEAEEGGAGGEFGDSVALSSTGKIALIGAPEANDHTGAAWAFAQPLKAATTHALRPR